MTFATALYLFLQSRIASGCRASTVANYDRYLRAFASYRRIHETDEIDHDAVRAYLSHLATLGHRGTTIENKRIVIVTWLNWLYNEGHIDRGDWSKRIRPTRSDKRTPRHMTADECRRFLLTAQCMHHDSAIVAKRNIAMVYMFLDTGLRKSELLNLKLNDVDLRERTVTVGEESKSRTERVVKFSPITLRFLRGYLHTRKACVTPYLWISRGSERPSTQWVYLIVVRIARAAGLDRVSPHALRHTYATLSIDNGIPVTSLQQLLGHKRLNTTMRYVHLSNERALKDCDAASPVSRLAI